MLEPDPEKRPDIYQVSSVAFSLLGRENPVQNLLVSFVCNGLDILLILVITVHNPNKLWAQVIWNCNLTVTLFQKSPTPHVEDLPVPQFESESKKTQVKVVNKTASAPMVEGTSVMPRQRPKGASTTPLNLSNLPLALNPSPTTVKKSQSPVTSDSQFQAFSSSKSGLSQPTYPPVTTYSVFPANSQAFFTPAQEVPEKHLETLFQSSVYPDPFRDEKSEFDSAGSLPDAPGSVPSPNSPDAPGIMVGNQGLSVKPGLVESTSQCVVGTADTPPSTPNLVVPKGHRRNMSDTTAFNK